MPRLVAIGFAGVTVIFTVGCSAVVDGVDAETANHGRETVTAVQLEGVPLTVSMSTMGYLAEGDSWHLSVNSAGQAELTLVGGTRRQFQVPQGRMAELRKALVQEQFFDLNGEYGARSLDYVEESVTVAAGRRVQTVRVYHLTDTDEATLRSAIRPIHPRRRE